MVLVQNLENHSRPLAARVVVELVVIVCVSSSLRPTASQVDVRSGPSAQMLLLFRNTTASVVSA